MASSEGDVRFEKLLRALGYACLRVQKGANGGFDGDIVLNEVRFKLDQDNRTSVLVIVKAASGEGKKVAFVGGPDFETAMLALGKALAGASLKWREDRPYNP